MARNDDESTDEDLVTVTCIYIAQALRLVRVVNIFLLLRGGRGPLEQMHLVFDVILRCLSILVNSHQASSSNGGRWNCL